MRPQSARRGWCPTAAVPMAAADGLLLRVRPEAGRLTSRTLRSLADIAGNYGNGALVVTRRAKLELRGIGEGGAAAEALQAAGLAPSAPGEQARPDIIVSPATDLDGSAEADVDDVHRALASALAEWPPAAELPAKIGLVVDGGGRAHVGASDGDLRFDALRRGDRVLYRVALGGTRSSATLLGLCSPESVPAVALDLLARFNQLRRGREDAIWRLRHAVAAHGVEPFREAVAALLKPLSEEPSVVDLPPPALGTVEGWYGVAYPFGRLDVGALRRLADVVDESGAGNLRVLPTRALLLPGVSADAAETLRQTGASESDADPRLRAEACSGLGGCAHASTHTRADAVTLADRVPGLLAGERRCVLHVSGCAKGCAHSGPAPITLTGNDGRYDLALMGGPGDEPLWRGLDADAAASRLAALERVLIDERASDEQLEDVLARLDRAALRERIGRELTSG